MGLGLGMRGSVEGAGGEVSGVCLEEWGVGISIGCMRMGELEKQRLGQQQAGGKKPGLGSSVGEKEHLCLLETENCMAWMR